MTAPVPLSSLVNGPFPVRVRAHSGQEWTFTHIRQDGPVDLVRAAEGGGALCFSRSVLVTVLPSDASAESSPGAERAIDTTDTAMLDWFNEHASDFDAPWCCEGKWTITDDSHCGTGGNVRYHTFPSLRHAIRNAMKGGK